MFTIDRTMTAEIEYRSNRMRKDLDPASSGHHAPRSRAVGSTPVPPGAPSSRRDEHGRRGAAGQSGATVSVAGAHDGVRAALRSADLVGRDAELDDLGRPARHRCVRRGHQRRGRAARRRRGRRQDPAADRAARPRRRATAGRSPPVTASTWPTAACPTCPSPRSSAGSRSTSPTSSSQSLDDHPALGRLQPGRRIRHREAGADDQSLDARRPLRRRARPPRAGRRRGPAPRRGRGRPLGRPVHPRHAQLPLHPSLRRPGSPSSCPTAPTTCTAATRCAARSASGPGCPASSGCSSSRCWPTPTCAAWSRRLHPDADARARDRRHRRPAPRATPSSSRSSSGATSASGGSGARRPRRRAAGPARPARRRGPRRWCGSPRVAGRQVSHDLLAEVCDLGPAALETALRTAVEANVLVPAGPDSYAFRHALLGEAVYDDLLPGERVRLHATYAEVLRTGRAPGAAAELARHARLGQDHRTALLASHRGRQRRDARRRSRGGRPALPAGAHAASPTRAVGPTRRHRRRRSLVTRTSDALIAAGHLAKAAAVVREQLDPLPADAPDADRGQLLAALAELPDPPRHPGGPARLRRRGGGPAPRGEDHPARQGPRPPGAGALRLRRRRGGAAGRAGGARPGRARRHAPPGRPTSSPRWSGSTRSSAPTRSGTPCST